MTGLMIPNKNTRLKWRERSHSSTTVAPARVHCMSPPAIPSPIGSHPITAPTHLGKHTPVPTRQASRTTIHQRVQISIASLILELKVPCMSGKMTKLPLARGSKARCARCRSSVHRTNPSLRRLPMCCTAKIPPSYVRLCEVPALILLRCPCTSATAHYSGQRNPL